MTDQHPPQEQAFTPPTANAVARLSADVTIPPAEGTSVIHQAYPLRQPKEEANEILVRVRGSALRKARIRLETLTSSAFPWPEVLLGVATLAAGGVLGAVASDVTLEQLRGKFFFLILPPLAVGCAVAYGMLRHFGAVSASEVAKAVLEDIPDPDQTT